MDSKNLERRKLELDDSDSIYKLWGRIVTSSRQPITRSWSLAKIEKEMEHGLGRGFVSLNGDLVAFLLFRIAGDIIEVSLLASSSAWRRKGLMSSLIQSIFEEFQDVKEIWLEVHRENKLARLFYATLGFQEVGVRRGYYGPNEDAILYTLNKSL